jgi:hypothetical protein
MISMTTIRIGLAALTLALAGANAGCGDKCEKPAEKCPALPNPPAKVPIDLAGILAGFEAGAGGSGSFTVPVLGGISVTVTCGGLKIEKDKPEAGKTKVTGSCTFKKLGLSGTASIELVIDKDGNGHIAASGKADFVVYDQDINVWVDLKGGVQSGKTITVNAEANGQCFQATLTRDGDKLIAEATNPKTKIEVNKK